MICPRCGVDLKQYIARPDWFYCSGCTYEKQRSAVKSFDRLRILLGKANHIAHPLADSLAEHAVHMIKIFKNKGHSIGEELDYYLNAPTPTAYTVRRRSLRKGLDLLQVMELILEQVYSDPNDISYYYKRN